MKPDPRYGIRPGYHHARYTEDFDAVSSGEHWQEEVYARAARLLEEKKGKSVIDIGCGSGFKLLQYMGRYPTTGIEVEPTFTWLKKTHPDRNWLLYGNCSPEMLEADLVVCADVIEHVPDPDVLLHFIRRIRFRYLILSTPEREAVAGRSDYGPPENTCHYREWSWEEFRDYIAESFKIEEQQLFPGKSTTQVVICSPKNNHS